MLAGRLVPVSNWAPAERQNGAAVERNSRRRRTAEIARPRAHSSPTARTSPSAPARPYPARRRATREVRRPPGHE